MMSPGPHDPPSGAPARSPSTAADLAAETLDLFAWILTPEDGYEPVDELVPSLLRAAACRLRAPHPASGPALCRHVYEVAAAAAAFVLAVRHTPDPDPAPTLDLVDLLTRLETVPRAALPDALRAAARICQHAYVHETHGATV